jgi:hypothetical protein
VKDKGAGDITTVDVDILGGLLKHVPVSLMKLFSGKNKTSSLGSTFLISWIKGTLHL